MNKLLKAGFIISLVLLVLLVVGAVACFICAGLISKDEVEMANFISSGVQCIIWAALSIFAIVVTKKAQARIEAKQVSIALAVFVIISGAVSNVVNIPAGILMIINRNKINA